MYFISGLMASTIAAMSVVFIAKQSANRGWLGLLTALAVGGATILAFVFFWMLQKLVWEAPLWLQWLVLGLISFQCGRWALQFTHKRIRSGFEQLGLFVFAFAAAIAVFTMLGIIASVTFESILFFRQISPLDFFFGTHWSPQIAIREDQQGASGAFGFIPLFVGTMQISGIAMLCATPMGLFSAIYLSEFASSKMRNRIKPILEILAGVPTIVYGFFALSVLSPSLVRLGGAWGIEIAGESALAAGFVMAMLLLPFIISLTEDALYAVPSRFREGALGLGATRCEFALGVLIPVALPGISAGILLAFSRAIGETMIVVMAAGISANLTLNPLEAVTTVTVQILTLLTGDQSFDDAKTLAAFALGLVLFMVTLSFNVFAFYMVRRYREHYD